MKRPLLTETHSAEEYNYLYTDSDNMNYYSAKKHEDYYVLVDDYDSEVFTLSECMISSEKHICLLAENRFLCVREGKYGVVDYEGWEIIPFVYDEFKIRNEDCDESRFDVCINNKWKVINLSGKDVYKVKQKVSNPINQPFTIVEDTETKRKGVVRFDGVEIIPSIYSQIKDVYLHDDNNSTIYFLVGFGDSDNIEPECYINGIWGCYNWKGEEIIPVKFHSIHCVKNYFVAGNDEHIWEGYHNDEERYIGTYELYDKNGIMTIGGFNQIQINNDCFVLTFGVKVYPYWQTMYWNGETYKYKVSYDKSISIIIDKNLKSLIPIHLYEESTEEIKFEYDVLANSISEGNGMLVGEYAELKPGVRYTPDNRTIQRICVKSANFEDDNIIKYYPFKEVKVSEKISEYKLCGLIFCKERKIIPPTYRSVKVINSEMIFIQDSKGLVGIKNGKEELVKTQFDLITNPHENMAIAFKINNIQEKGYTIDYQCEYTILKFDKNTIKQERGGIISGAELYELLHPLNLPNLYGEAKSREEEYWNNIPRNDESNHFWFPQYSDFKFLEEVCKEDYIDGDSDDWDDNWDYYNDNLDIDQQSPEFWNF